MQKRISIINLSAPEIQVRVLADPQLEAADLSLPWEVGFRQEMDGTLIPCFDEAFERLDPNHPKEVQFAELDVFLKEITDVETLEHLFRAFLEEIFHRRLPEHGYPIEAMTVYVIVPYQWTYVHRQQLRKALKSIQDDSQITGLNPPAVILRGMLSQVLCLIIYYQEAWANILATESRIHLFLVDFERRDLILYQLFCQQAVDDLKVELRDIRRFPDFFMDREKQVSDVQRSLQTVKENLTVAVGFSGRINSGARDIIELLKTRCEAIFLEPQETAPLLGGTELIQQFETKKFTKTLHFNYQFCFGVRLPDGEWVELIPKTSSPPCHRKKAFRVTGVLEPFDIYLCCGLSLTNNSDVHQLAVLEINSVESSRTLDFVLSVALSDSTHGTFTVNLPDRHEPRSVEFTVPVLMD